MPTCTGHDRGRSERMRPPGTDRPLARLRQELCLPCPSGWSLTKTPPIVSRNASLRSICLSSSTATESALHADAPIEAPTVRGFVSLLLEGLNGATVEEVLRSPATWSSGAGWPRSWECSGSAA